MMKPIETFSTLKNWNRNILGNLHSYFLCCSVFSAWTLFLVSQLNTRLTSSTNPAGEPVRCLNRSSRVGRRASVGSTPASSKVERDPHCRDSTAFCWTCAYEAVIRSGIYPVSCLPACVQALIMQRWGWQRFVHLLEAFTITFGSGILTLLVMSQVYLISTLWNCHVLFDIPMSMCVRWADSKSSIFLPYA